MLRAVAVVCMLAASLITLAQLRADVMWRHDGQGRFPNISPPLEWRADRNVLWKTSVEVGGYSSPIVVEDKVFVTAEMGSLICLDLETGRLLWQKDLFNKDSPDLPADLSKALMRGCGGDSKQSTPTPTSNGRSVFYVNAMGLCACYDLAGQQQWIRIIETAKDEEHFSASPIFFGERIILHWGCLLALDAKDGRTLWKAPDAFPTHGTPTLARIGDVDVIVTTAGDIVRLSDGLQLCSGLFDSTYATPLLENGVLYVVDNESKAWQLPTIAEPGLRPKELWKARLSGEFMASPLYRDGLLYTLEAAKCRLHVLDAKTGELLIPARGEASSLAGEKPDSGLKIEGLNAGKYAYASPVAAGRHMFFFDDTGHTAVLELGRGYRPVRINALDDALVGTPFFVGNKIIMRGSKSVYCIRAKS